MRVLKGWSLSEFSRQTGITSSNLWMIENNKVSPTHKTICKIVRAFEIDLSDFYSDIEIV